MTTLALYAVDEPCHDHHAGVGELARRRPLAAGATVETPLTRSNYRVLAAMPATLLAWGVARWRLRVLADDEPPAGAWSRWTPRLAMALPHALHAATRARRLGLPTVVVDAPLCLLGPLTDLGDSTGPRAFAPSCATCAVRAGCGGVSPGYLERFGAGELTPASGSPAPV